MSASIKTEIQSLSPQAIVELFILDTTMLTGGAIYYFHSGTNGLLQPVVWQGKTYQPFPIEAEGFDKTTQGTLPRPRLRVANVDGLISSLLAESGDLVGCKITRKRTLARYLDAVNFPGGVNPDADQYQQLPDEQWFIDQKVSENFQVVEWELASAFDLAGVMLPNRQIIQNSCPWKYRGPDCGYNGAYYDINDQPCTADKDYCSKRLTSCEVRFPVGIIPFGGFPGAVRNG